MYGKEALEKHLPVVPLLAQLQLLQAQIIYVKMK
jgi:hypothetical protein